jgi:predicted dehydrogenase
MKKTYSRREFLNKSSATVAGIALGATTFSANSYSRILGANDRVNFAVVGLHGRGNAHINAISACQNAMVTYICDVDQREIDRVVPIVQQNLGQAPKTEKDLRILLESKEVDAITIATPEHLQTPFAILGVKAGKHVYLEKPGSHNPAEGEMVVEAQKKYGKLIQFGDQQRSSVHSIEAIQKIRDGIIGRVYLGKAWYSNTRKSIGVGRKVPVPDYLDWELWQGPAPRRAYRDNVHPYNWHWFWHWGTGETLNNAIHEVDICRWALDVDLPKKVNAIGGRYHFKDDWEFYDTLVTTFEYDDKMIVWEGKSCQGKNYFGRGRGVTIHGTEGTLLMDRDGYEIYNLNDEKIFEYKKEETEGSMDVVGDGPITNAHFQNFIKGILMGEKLNSPIYVGNIAATMLHLSNIAWKFGRQLEIDPENGHIRKDKDAMSMWRREYEPGWEPKV